jgi:hypothetical protein
VGEIESVCGGGFGAHVRGHVGGGGAPDVEQETRHCAKVCVKIPLCAERIFACVLA